ncbi:MAG: hypothetical protein WAW46_14160 [Polaromonas sp.]
MNKLISRFFRGPQQAETAPKATTSNRDNPATIEDGSDNGVRRQLVQVLLRDVIRRHGIPAHWIELQMLVVNSASRGAGLYVRLLVKQWDARLMNHAQAFQNALLADIARFEPNASQWLHGISWQLEMADTCPYTTLPDKSFWSEPAKQAAPAVQAIPASPPAAVPMAESTPESEAREDLERLFLIRDQEINRAADGYAPVGYEKTQPSPL